MALSKDKCFDQVSGKVANRQQKQHEASKLCEQCLVDNDRKYAAGWCETCDEMLCSDCHKGHCKLKITRDHVLMSLEKMRTYKQMQRAPTTCKHHGDKPLEYYCESHKQLGYKACFVGEHRACKWVVCINEMKSSQTEDFKLLRKNLNDFTARINRSKKRASMAGSTVHQQYDQAVSEIQAAGTEMKDYIDRLVNAKIAEAKKIKEANLSTIESVTTINDEVEAKVKAYTDFLKFFTKEGNTRLLFINMLSIELASHALESKIQEAEEMDIMGIEFVFNTQLSRIMYEVNDIGMLDCTDVCRVQPATQVLKPVHVLALPTSDRKVPIPVLPRFYVRVNLDINLSHIILCNQGLPTARIGIYEGQTLLFECTQFFRKGKGEVVVDVVQRDGRRGVILQAGHIYTIAYDNVCRNNNNNIAKSLDQGILMKEAVTFTFTSMNDNVFTGPCVEMVFTIV